MFPIEHMRAARAAMLRAALAAFFADVLDDGSDHLTIEVEGDGFGSFNIDITQLHNGVPTVGYSL